MEQINHEALWTTFINDSDPTPGIEKILSLYRHVEGIRPYINAYLDNILHDPSETEFLTVPELVEIISTVQDERICQDTFDLLQTMPVNISQSQLIKICTSTVCESVARTAYLAIYYQIKDRIFKNASQLEALSSDDLHQALKEMCDAFTPLMMIASHSPHAEIARPSAELVIHGFASKKLLSAIDQPLGDLLDLAMINIAFNAKHPHIQKAALEMLDGNYYELSSQAIFIMACNSTDDEEAVGGYQYLRSWLRQTPSQSTLASGTAVARSEALSVMLFNELLERTPCDSNVLAFIAKAAGHPSVRLMAAEELLAHPEVAFEELELISSQFGSQPVAEKAREKLSKRPETILKAFLPKPSSVWPKQDPTSPNFCMMHVDVE